MFTDWLFGKKDKQLEVTTCDIYKDFLDIDQYAFCVRHGLSTKKSDYTDSELSAIKARAIVEKVQKKEENRIKLNKILSE